MQFKPELADKILRGEKRQTRRPHRSGDEAVLNTSDAIVAVKRNGRFLWRVGGFFAVQPGRGKRIVWYYPGKPHVMLLDDRQPDGSKYPDDDLLRIGYRPLRIKLAAIRCEDVRHISHEDALAEGFSNRLEFWQVWCGFYDPPMAKVIAGLLKRTGSTEVEVYRVASLKLGERPTALYSAWALTFGVLP